MSVSFVQTTFLVLLCFKFDDFYHVQPGPKYKSTLGEIIPKPQHQTKLDQYFVVRGTLFRFENVGHECITLEEARHRYWKIIAKTYSPQKRGPRFEAFVKKQLLKSWWQTDSKYLGPLDTLKVNLTSSCNDRDYPSLDMKEEYVLNVTQSHAILTSDSLWGILRGLETFSQLIYLADDEFTLRINATNIHDYPKFPHRGLLLDTSRHFLPLYIILQNLDAMSYNKFNVLHWHITDDQSFPYQSKTFPQLSGKGAYHPITKIYEPSDVQKVIEYARNRGIRVVVEFDTPGHTRSWGEGIQKILTTCYDKDHKPNGYYGPMDPSSNYLYKFLNKFFQEIHQVFPDKYIHLGGDEIDFDCWKSNSNISEFMEKLNITGDYKALESYYIQKLIDIVHTNLNSSFMVWEEVFVNRVKLPNSAIIDVWKDTYQEVLKQVTESGHQVLLSACWYLDHLEGLADWIPFYKCDPYDFNGNDVQKDLVLGGEACMWGEAVNENNIISRVWPRACAAAEKLWSSVTTRTNTNITEEQLINFAERLEEHSCRMNYRGIQAQPPNGPSYCL